MDIVDKIIKYRKINNISAREMARRLDIDIAYMSRIENRKVEKISVQLLNKICKEINLNFLEELLNMYDSKEIKKLNLFGNFDFIDDKVARKYLIKDDNSNRRLSILKILNGYKNNEINDYEILGLLSAIFNINAYDYLTKEEVKKITK